MGGGKFQDNRSMIELEDKFLLDQEDGGFSVESFYEKNEISRLINAFECINKIFIFLELESIQMNYR